MIDYIKSSFVCLILSHFFFWETAHLICPLWQQCIHYVLSERFHLALEFINCCHLDWCNLGVKSWCAGVGWLSLQISKTATNKPQIGKWFTIIIIYTLFLLWDQNPKVFSVWKSLIRQNLSTEESLINYTLYLLYKKHEKCFPFSDTRAKKMIRAKLTQDLTTASSTGRLFQSFRDDVCKNSLKINSRWA